jgi:hypothetical protein
MVLNVRFILKAAKMTLFCVVTLCRLVRYTRVSEEYNVSIIGDEVKVLVSKEFIQLEEIFIYSLAFTVQDGPLASLFFGVS